MSQDGLFGAPAGWYPDPLGLPQLRWWNNHAWTEQTSAARQPMVVQDTKFAWADDDLPSRRDERERERQQQKSDNRAPAATVQPTAETLRQLEPPRATAKPQEPVASATQASVAADAAAAAAAAATAAQNNAAAKAAAEALFNAAPAASAPAAAATAAPTSAPAAPDAASFGSLFDTTAAPAATVAEPSGESLDSLFGAKPETRRGARPPRTPIVTNETIASATPGGTIRSSTGPAWIIAMIPLFQLVASLILMTALGQGNNVGLFVGILFVPYFIVVALAYFDWKQLSAAGMERPAHWAFAFGTAPVYLLMRARATIRETGHGIGPVLVWAGLGLLHIVSAVAIPGLIISTVPSVFTAQIEQSVVSDALLIGGSNMSVECPDAPPVLEGQTILCVSTTDSGSVNEVTVALQRVNGWVAWQVLDWGKYTLEG